MIRGVLDLCGDVVHGVADRAEVFEVVVFDAKTGDLVPQRLFQGFDEFDQASESAFRSSANEEDSLIPSGSISKISAS